MELKETIKMMQSEDYCERFKAEYQQTKIRAEKLRKMLAKHAAGALDFEPKCPISLLSDQYEIMDDYLKVLEIRAEFEGINLDLIWREVVNNEE